MGKRFSVRVELFGGADYDLLHAVMHRLGFRRFVVDGEKKMWKLPTGSYLLADGAEAETVDAICKRVMLIAAAIAEGKKRPYVWVVQVATFSVWTEIIEGDPDAQFNGLKEKRVDEILRKVGLKS